jgi:hypothetical protein
MGFAEARRLRVAIHELEGGASINDLAVENPLDTPVLFYGGQEILGAQQNRVIERTVLVTAQSKTVIPVTCVEQGDGITPATVRPSTPRRRPPIHLDAEHPAVPASRPPSPVKRATDARSALVSTVCVNLVVPCSRTRLCP